MPDLLLKLRHITWLDMFYGSCGLEWCKTAGFTVFQNTYDSLGSSLHKEKNNGFHLLFQK